MAIGHLQQPSKNLGEFRNERSIKYSKHRKKTLEQYLNFLKWCREKGWLWHTCNNPPIDWWVERPVHGLEKNIYSLSFLSTWSNMLQLVFSIVGLLLHLINPISDYCNNLSIIGHFHTSLHAGLFFCGLQATKNFYAEKSSGPNSKMMHLWDKGMYYLSPHLKHRKHSIITGESCVGTFKYITLFLFKCSPGLSLSSCWN